MNLFLDIVSIAFCILIGWLIASVVGTIIGKAAGWILKRLLDKWEQRKS